MPTTEPEQRINDEEVHPHSQQNAHRIHEENSKRSPPQQNQDGPEEQRSNEKLCRCVTSAAVTMGRPRTFSIRLDSDVKRQIRSSYHSGITEFEERRSRTWLAKAAMVVLALLVFVWVILPVVRIGELLVTSPVRSAPTKPAGLALQSVRFDATDGVRLSGWLTLATPRAPTILLVPGFKGDRAGMIPYARFLHAAGYNVLLYDSRGTGASSGNFSLGLREVDDVLGAVRYLGRTQRVKNHRIGILGVSLGAGVAIVAAARSSRILATVADSAYVDQRAVVDRLDSLHLGPLSVPLAPIAPLIVDRVLGKPLASFSPLHSIRKIAPRAILLIHSDHDRNPTTPLSGAFRLKHAAGRNAFLWVAPKGGHSRAYAAQPGQYRRGVVNFFRRFVGRP
jgi:fermentation-respiration switch protein FrsA (DUF1100 family)